MKIVVVQGLSLLVLDGFSLIRLMVYGMFSDISTGGQCINYLHQMVLVIGFIEHGWIEDGLNDFNFIKLHWTVHPDREDEWRKNKTHF